MRIGWTRYDENEIDKSSYNYWFIWEKGKARIFVGIDQWAGTSSTTHFEFFDLGYPAISSTGYRSHFTQGVVPVKDYKGVGETLIKMIMKDELVHIKRELAETKQGVLFDERRY